MEKGREYENPHYCSVSGFKYLDGCMHDEFANFAEHVDGTPQDELTRPIADSDWVAGYTNVDDPPVLKQPQNTAAHQGQVEPRAEELPKEEG